MPRSSPLKNNFAAGELSPLLEGRTDIEQYTAGVKLCKNYVPIVQGPVTRRPGTQYVADTKGAGASPKARLIPFQFSTEQAYVLEVGHQYIRFFYDPDGNGLVRLESPPGTPVEVATTYSTQHLQNIQYTQSADVLYLVHPDFPPAKLQRTSATSFTLTDLDLLDGPYFPINTTTTTLNLSGTTGSVTVTASSNVFTANDVGRLIRWRDPANEWTWLEITAYASAVSVTATIRGQDASATGATTFWRLGVFATSTGFPSTVAFFDQRLFLAGSPSAPQRLDGSVIGDFENFQPTAVDGIVADNNAVSTTLLASTVNSIQWMLDEEKGLFVGTTGGEWLVSPADTTSTITPTNIRQDRSSTFGSLLPDGSTSSPVKGEQVTRAGSNIVFIQKSHKRVFQLDYEDSRDGFETSDISLTSEHLPAGGVEAVTFSSAPYPIIWAVRTGGILIGVTYDRSIGVVGWHRHVVGGVSSAQGDPATVESVAVIPGPSGRDDYVVLLTGRWINGAFVRQIEYLTEYWRDGDLQENAWFSDAAVQYSGAATTTITGLDHLEGETVSILADGAVHPDKVVSSGQITLDREATKATVGLQIIADGQLLRFETGAADGTAMGKTQRIHRLFVRLWQTLGFKFGQSADELDEVIFRTDNDAMDTAVPLFTGDVELDIDQDYSNQVEVYFRQDQPLPGTILAFMPHIKTEDRG
jgi:hypothetical protein